MNHLTTRELLYLEDTSKMFETFSKVCDSAVNSTTNPELKSILQSMSQEHRQWISDTATLVKGNHTH